VRAIKVINAEVVSLADNFTRSFPTPAHIQASSGLSDDGELDACLAEFAHWNRASWRLWRFGLRAKHRQTPECGSDESSAVH
jgi:hypothetical protein